MSPCVTRVWAAGQRACYARFMPIPSDTALKGRARVLLEAMSERGRWIYAVPRDAGEAATVRAMLIERGLRVEEEDAAAGVARLSREADRVAFVLYDAAPLEVLLVEATGDEAPKILADILERTGFYAQSQLLRTALDVRDPEATKALRTLSHMVVVWDEDWSDLFLLHLASPDPVVRHDAAMALTVASMVARDPGPSLALLAEAEKRETYPKLRETIREVIQVISGTSGGPVEIKAE